jgi:hypothetical protein
MSVLDVMRAGCACGMTAVFGQGSPLLATRNLGAAGRASYDMDLGAMVVWLMIAAGGIAAVSLGLWWFTRRMHRRSRYSHAALLAGLCRLHGLTRRGRALLGQLARASGLAHPARLFLEPEWYEPSRLPPALRGRSDEIARLRQRLFGADEPA